MPTTAVQRTLGLKSVDVGRNKHEMKVDEQCKPWKRSIMVVATATSSCYCSRMVCCFSMNACDKQVSACTDT